MLLWELPEINRYFGETPEKILRGDGVNFDPHEIKPIINALMTQAKRSHNPIVFHVAFMLSYHYGWYPEEIPAIPEEPDFLGALIWELMSRCHSLPYSEMISQLDRLLDLKSNIEPSYPRQEALILKARYLLFSGKVNDAQQILLSLMRPITALTSSVVAEFYWNLTQAELFFLFGDDKTSNSFQKRAKKISESSESSWQRILLSITKGNFNLIRGNIKVAQQEFSLAEKLMMNIKEINSTINIRHKTGSAEVLWTLGRLEDAKTLIKETLLLSKNSSNILGTASSLYILSRIYWSLGIHSKMKEVALEGLDLIEQVGDIPIKTLIYNSLGIQAWLVGEYSKTEEYFQIAIKLFGSMNDPRGMCRILNNLARLDWSRGDYNNALKRFLEAEKFCNKINEIQLLAIIKRNIGKTLTKQGEPIRAIAYLEESQRLMEESHTRGEYYIDTLFAFVMAYIESNHLDKAKEYLNIAIQETNDANLPRWMIQGELFRAHLVKALGKINNARILYKEVKKLAKELKEPEVYVEAILNQAQLEVIDLAKGKGDSAENLNELLNLLSEAQTLSKEQKLTQVWHQCMIIAAKVATIQFDFAEARSYYNIIRNHALKNNLENVERQALELLEDLDTQEKAIQLWGIQTSDNQELLFREKTIREMQSYIDDIVKIFSSM